MNRFAAIAAALVLLAFPAAAQQLLPATVPCTPGNTILNGVLWMQKSAEYKAVSMQTYNAAQRALDAALKEKSYSKLPLAIILDLDETALLNIDFEVQAVRSGVTYNSDMWRVWTQRGAAIEVPGAQKFLTSLPKTVTPFYVTNRKFDSDPLKSEEAGTLENLKDLGYPVVAVTDPDNPAADNLLLKREKPEWEDDKTSRRDWVAQRYRVLLLLGDDLNDFTSATNKTTAERDAILSTTTNNWGTKWFILPNPLYGSWQKAVLADELLRKDPDLKDPNAATLTLSGCEELQTKFDALK